MREGEGEGGRDEGGREGGGGREEGGRDEGGGEWSSPSGPCGASIISFLPLQENSEARRREDEREGEEEEEFKEVGVVSQGVGVVG